MNSSTVKVLSLIAVAIGVIYLLGIGFFTETRIYNEGGSSYQTEVNLHPFELVGERGGLPMLLATSWFFVTIFFLKNLIAAIFDSDYKSGAWFWFIVGSVLFVLTVATASI